MVRGLLPYRGSTVEPEDEMRGRRRGAGGLAILGSLALAMSTSGCSQPPSPAGTGQGGARAGAGGGSPTTGTDSGGGGADGGAGEGAPGSGGAGPSLPGAGGGAGAGGGVAGAGGAGPSGPAAGGAPGGTPVAVKIPDAEAAALAAARADLAADRPADVAGFQTRWRESTLAALPYDPTTAQNLDRVQASQSALNDRELAVLASDGFVISARQTFPTFFEGYTSLYADHLPLYVSLDSVMHAVHRSYDTVLSDLETSLLLPKMVEMLQGMQARLATGTGAELPATSRADADLLLTVGLSLLGKTVQPVAGADPGTVQALLDGITAAQGQLPVELFGEERYVDFSQFKPRGHYTSSPALSQYFQAMMWLGRTDLRLLQYDTSDPSAPPSFSRRQFLDAVLLAELAQGQPLADWSQIEDVLHAMVGESDNMTVADFAKLPAVAGVTALGDLVGLSDTALGQALLDGGFGIQRIASQILLVPPGGAGAPLDRVFLLLGQRFVIDSQVFTDVTFDRVRGDPARMMPNPLDVAFAALGNDAAVAPLAGELSTYPGYLGALHDARRLVDQHGDDFWGGSLYTLWMSALRGLSTPDGQVAATPGLPAVMRTASWGRRLLNTQLASWAQLRHDTLLYAKQSYTGVPTCEFPDAYVDPYPDAWNGLVRLAQMGQQLGALMGGAASYDLLTSYFASLEKAVTTLRDMATAERAGVPFTADQMAFINQAVSLVEQSGGCVPTEVPEGWYPGLFINRDDVTKVDPTIADVHTDPASGRVLHVATGLPRVMVVTADTCTGPHAYVGLVSSYFEQTTNDLTRLDDQQWSTQVMASPPPPEVSWMSDLVVQ